MTQLAHAAKPGPVFLSGAVHYEIGDDLARIVVAVSETEPRLRGWRVHVEVAPCPEAEHRRTAVYCHVPNTDWRDIGTVPDSSVTAVFSLPFAYWPGAFGYAMDAEPMAILLLDSIAIAAETRTLEVRSAHNDQLLAEHNISAVAKGTPRQRREWLVRRYEAAVRARAATDKRGGA